MTKSCRFTTFGGGRASKVILAAVLAASFISASFGAEKAEEPEKEASESAAAEKPADYVISKAAKKKLTSPLKLSRERIGIVMDVIEKYMKQNVDITSEKVKAAIFSEIAEKMPLDPAKVPDLSSSEDISKLASEAVAKKYPLTAQDLSAKVEKKYAKDYVLAKTGDKVSVVRRRGGRMEKVTGKLFKITKKDVRIGDTSVQFMDMDEQSRMKMDAEFRKSKMADEIAREVRLYSSKKNAFREDVVSDLKKKQIANNEKAGYILCRNNWISAKLLASGIIKFEAPAYMKARQEKLEAEAAAEAQREAEALAEKEKAAAKAEQEKQPADVDEARHAEAVAKSEKMMAEITLKYNGIDVEQGFRKAIWGLTRSEVRDVLAKEPEFSTLKSEINSDVLSGIDGRETGSISLHYFNNKLYKTTEVLGSMTTDELVKYADDLHEILGPSEEENEYGKDKSIIDDMASGAYVQNGSQPVAKAAADKGKKDAKKSKRAKNEPAKQAEETRDYAFNWNGKISSARLTLKLHKNSEGVITYENVTLTKEAKTK